MAVLAACVVALGPGRAWAQTPGGGLPDSVVQAIQLSESDKAQIKAFAQGNSQNLASTDATLRKRDQDSLQQVLALSRSPSTSFRLELTNELIAALDAAAKKNDVGAVAALDVAGTLATPGSLQMIRGYLDSPNRVIRHQAGGLSMRSIFQVIAAAANAGAAPSFESVQVTQAIDALARAAAGEKDELVLDRMVQSLCAAAEVEAYRGSAFAGLYRVVDEQVKVVGNRPQGAKRLLALLRAVDEGIFRQVSAAGAKYDSEAARHGARVAWRLVGMTTAIVRAGNLPRNPGGGTEPVRDTLAKIMNQSQNVLPLVAVRLGKTDLVVANAAAELRKNSVDGDAAFLIEVEKINAVLSRPPFDLR